MWSDTIKSKQLAKYIGRYVRHPAIANSRITDAGKGKIKFFYPDNGGNKVSVTKTADSFITSLIQHIPPRQFKLIRYYGAYSRNKKRNYVHI